MAKIDSSLIDLCRQGKSSAQHTLYRLSYSTMKGACIRYLNNPQDVSDTINRSFLKVINSLHSFDESRSYDAWLRRIVINTALDQLRSRNRRTKTRDLDEVMELNLNAQDWSVDNIADLAFDAEELYDMMERLPEKTRIIFNMFAIDGYSHREIGQALKMSDGTSKWHVSKARETLQKLILSKEQEKNRVE